MSNPNSAVDFFKSNLNKIPALLNEVKQVMEEIDTPLKNDNLYIFMNVLYDICRNEKKNLLDEYLKAVQTESNVELLTEVRNAIVTFLSEEKDNVIIYMRELNNRRKNNYLKLTKMEYKFIGLCSASGLEKGNIEPKILITLFFNDGSHQLIESSFASFKKLQEEIEHCLSSFNSSYSRRIQVFAK